MQFSKPYQPPIVTVDAVVFQLNGKKLEVLLIKRSKDPFAGCWALPGGYSAADQTTRQALQAVTQRKAGINLFDDLKYLEQLYTFDAVARDPRGHAVSVTYYGCGLDIELRGGSEEAMLFAVDALPEMAYDHVEIIHYARERLAAKLTYTNAVYGLLPKRFTLTQLQTTYEAVFGRELDKRNFRKKFLSLNLIHETDEMLKGGAHRPARLYEFNCAELESLSRSFD